MNNNKIKSVIWAGVLGNILELYDYTLYGYFAAILATQFFPEGKPYTALLATYGIYALGFILRPLGAIMFGSIGDKMGRKRALEISILLMAVPTLCIGLLPTYYQVGILAPLLLVFMRLLQGLSVGGELVGSYTYLIEHAPENKKGFMGSWTLVGGFGGKLMGTCAAGTMAFLLTYNNLENWGWRIPFFFGLVFAFVGYEIRKRVSETPVFTNMQKSSNLTNSPIKEAISTSWKNILKAIGCMMIHTIYVHLLFVYFPTYLKTEIGLSYSQAMLSNFLALALTILLMPMSGSLSDKIGRKPVMFIGALAMTLLPYPAFLVIAQGDFFSIVVTHLVLATAFGFSHGPLPAFLTELFPPRIRYTSSGIAYNLSVCVFGGLSPFVVTILIEKLGTPVAPAYWITLCGVISTLTILTISEKVKKQVYAS